MPLPWLQVSQHNFGGQLSQDTSSPHAYDLRTSVTAAGHSRHRSRPRDAAHIWAAFRSGPPSYRGVSYLPTAELIQLRCTAKWRCVHTYDRLLCLLIWCSRFERTWPWPWILRLQWLQDQMHQWCMYDEAVKIQWCKSLHWLQYVLAKAYSRFIWAMALMITGLLQQAMPSTGIIRDSLLKKVYVVTEWKIPCSLPI